MNVAIVVRTLVLEIIQPGQHNFGNHRIRRSKLLRDTCPVGEAVPMRIPFQGGSAYKDPKVYITHADEVKIHLGNLVWPPQQTDSKEQ